ncbi:MAG: hypothetical protein ACK5IB_03065 [Qingshengfaniella sp.]
MRAAMLKARHSIMLIGWDFDARIRLEGDEGPERLGDFILWLASRTPALQIRLLGWDTGAFKALFRGNTLATILRWKWHRQITLTLDGAHPLASSHHQKIVVIDDRIAHLRNDLIAEHLGVTTAEVAARLAQSGSLATAIGALRAETKGRSLQPFAMPELNGLEEWLADNEILDPEGPDAIFEPLSERGLFRGWRKALRPRR